MNFNEYYKLQIKDGVLFVTYLGGPITLPIAKDLVKNRLDLAENKKMPVLVDTIDVNGIDREARSYLSSEEGLKGLKAGAIVTNSVFMKHMANVFMKISFNKSKMPARLFSNHAEALKWLKQFED